MKRTPISDELLSALTAVDRLNSWVRSQSFRRQSSSLRRVIYHFKRQAILRANADAPCEHGPFIWQASCRDCGGTGRYTDWNGYTHPHCRACSSSGTATLHFVESRIAGLFVWHSPADKFPTQIELKSTGNSGQGWGPNQAGRDLTVEEAAGYLNIAHEVFREPIPTFRFGGSWEDDYESDDAGYGLWVGEDEKRCAHCGGDSMNPDSCRCGHQAGRVAFTFYVCEACRASIGSPQYFNVPVPQQLWGHGYGRPNVNAWVVRQNAFALRSKRKV